MRLDRVGSGEVEISLEATPDHLNLIGIVHGGVIATLADTATGVAFRTVVPIDTLYVTSQLTLVYLAPARSGGRISARGRVVKRGWRSGYAEADVLDAEGTLLARGTALFTVMPERTAQ
jgi:uncharacterized protein (TIGR00369 family)